MTISYAYPTIRRAEPVPAPPSPWRLFGAGLATAVVVTLGPTGEPLAAADHGVVTTSAGPGTVIVGPRTRLVAVQPSITSW